MMKRKIDDKNIIKTLLKKHKAIDKMWPDELTPERAKEIEKIQEELRSKNEAIQKSMQEAHEDINVENLFKKKKNTFDMTLREEPPLTVKEAKRLDKLQDELLNKSLSLKSTQEKQMYELEKQQEPIVKAIKEQSLELKKQSRPRVKSRVETDRFRPRVASTPNRPLIEADKPLPESDLEVFETDIAPPPYDEVSQNRTIHMITSETESIGDIAREYLDSSEDRIYGIYYDFTKQKLAIGSQSITVYNNDIMLDNTKEKYKGTEGLWKLLTKNEGFGRGIKVKNIPDNLSYVEKMFFINAFTKEDYNNYKDILIKTNAMFQNHDPSKRPKSNGGFKWTEIISNIYKENKKGVSGSGLMINNDCPVQFRPVGSFQDLIDRMKLIRAEEHAGNFNSHNDIAAIHDFVKDREIELSVLKELLGNVGGQIESNWNNWKRVKKFNYHYLL